MADEQDAVITEAVAFSRGSYYPTERGVWGWGVQALADEGGHLQCGSSRLPGYIDSLGDCYPSLRPLVC